MRLPLVLTCLLLFASPAVAQIRHVAEMTAEDLRTLDRAGSVAILPGGILEAHGPYLPTFSDGYLNERLAHALAEAIVARPRAQALIFPTIPLGNSGANDIGAHYSVPGTYAVRFETLRAVFMDLADELGAQGFRRIFVVHVHGAPNHSRALDEAGDYFRDTYGGFMVHLGGVASVFAAIEGPKPEDAAVEDGLPIHAGMDETSWMLFLRPDLVRPGFVTAPPAAAGTMEEIARIAADPGWRGYFGSPRLASAAHGAAIWERLRAETVDVALRILDGADPRALPRMTQEMEKSPIDVQLDAASRRAEAARAARQEEWLRRRGSR